MDAMEKLNCKDDVACVSGIGCSSWIPCYYKLDVIHSMHGRALAFAEGLKLARPDKKILVFTGDGDCMAIGGNHLLHAAQRNIDLTVVMVNNYIYGMTGGQKSPTTPIGAKTKTSPFGCIDEPMNACKLVMSLGAMWQDGRRRIRFSSPRRSQKVWTTKASPSSRCCHSVRYRQARMSGAKRNLPRSWRNTKR